MNSLAHAGNLTITCDDDGTKSPVCAPTATAWAEAQHGRIVVCARSLQRQNCNILMEDLIHEVAHFTLQTDDVMIPPPPGVTSVRAEDVVRAYETNVSSLGTALTTGMNIINADSYRCYVMKVGEERIWCQSGGLEAVNPPTLAADPTLCRVTLYAWSRVALGAGFEDTGMLGSVQSPLLAEPACGRPGRPLRVPVFSSAIDRCRRMPFYFPQIP